MLTAASALAQTNVYKGFKYRILVEEAEITGYTDSLRNASGGEISVPGYIPHEGQYLPTSVGTAFKQCDWLKSVTIEYGCKGLGYNAFAECANLTTLKLPPTVDFFYKDFITDGYCANQKIIYTGLTITPVIANAFNSTNISYSVATKDVERQLLTAHPRVKVSVNPFEAFDYTINGNYYVITKMATAAGNGQSAIVGGVNPNVTVHPNSYRHTDYHATLNPVSYNCTLVPDSVFAGSAVESFMWPRAARLEAKTVIGKGAFSGCSKLATVDVSCTYIYSHAFYKCSSLTALTLEEGVDSIGECAFWHSPLQKTLNIPSTLRYLNGGVAGIVTDSELDGKTEVKYQYGSFFVDCNNVEEYVVDESNPTYASSFGLLYNKAKTRLYHCPNNYPTTPHIELTTKRIDYYSFAYLNNPKCVSLNFPYGVEQFGIDWARYSQYVRFIHIPSSAKDPFKQFNPVRTKADGGMSSLVAIQLGSEKPLTRSLYSSEMSVSSITVQAPAGLHQSGATTGYTAYKESLYWRRFNCEIGGYDVVIDGVSYLLNEASASRPATARVCYSDYTKALSGVLNIPETIEYNGTTYTVTSIDMEAFAGNTNITEINLPATVTTLEGATGEYTGSDRDGAQFRGCTALKIVNLPHDIKIIPNRCFSESGVTDVILPWGVVKIGDRAFTGCSLTTLLVPSSIKSWETKAFYDITSIHTFSFNKNFDVNNPCFRNTRFGTTKPVITRAADYAEAYDPTGNTEWSALFMNCTFNAYDFDEGTRKFTVNADGKTANIREHDNGEKARYLNLYPIAVDKYDRQFTITGIDARYTTSYEVILNNNIEYIGASAFLSYGGKKLTLPSSVKRIGDRAFYASDIRTLYADMTVLPELGTAVFGAMAQVSTLIVPSAVIKSYKNAEQWKDFYKIQGGSNHYKYPIYIGRRQLTEDTDMTALCDSLVAAGVMKEGGFIAYDDILNVLTLKNVDLSENVFVSGKAAAILYDKNDTDVPYLLEPLTIRCTNSKINHSIGSGLYILNGNVDLTGEGELRLGGRVNGALRLGENVNFNLVGGCSLVAEGRTYGITGSGSTSSLTIGTPRLHYPDTLYIKAKGPQNAVNHCKVIMNNGYDITVPHGAYIYNDDYSVVDGQYSYVQNKWLTIEQALLPVWVLGKQVNKSWNAEQWDEKLQSLRDEGVLNADGKIYYDLDTKTLTLDNIDVTFQPSQGAFVKNGDIVEVQNNIINKNGIEDFKIKVNGECSINAYDVDKDWTDAERKKIFLMHNSGLNFVGDGKLTVNLIHGFVSGKDFTVFGYIADVLDDGEFHQVVFNGPDFAVNDCDNFFYYNTNFSPNGITPGARFNYGTVTVNLRGGNAPFNGVKAHLNPSSEMNVHKPIGAKFKVGEFNCDYLYTAGGELVKTGTVLIAPGVPVLNGDVNGDGLINVVDVSTIYSVILGTDMTYADSADVDGNGIVNVVDVSEVYKIIVESE